MTKEEKSTYCLPLFHGAFQWLRFSIGSCLARFIRTKTVPCPRGKKPSPDPTIGALTAQSSQVQLWFILVKVELRNYGEEVTSVVLHWPAAVFPV